MLQRSDDANTSSLMQAAAIFVTEGTYAQQAWVLTTDSVVLNTTDIVFTVFASHGEYSGTSPISISGAKEVSLNDGGVTTAKLADGACTAAKLAAGCVDAADKFVAGVVGTAALAADCVTDAKCDFTDVAQSGIAAERPPHPLKSAPVGAPACRPADRKSRSRLVDEIRRLRLRR